MPEATEIQILDDLLAKVSFRYDKVNKTFPANDLTPHGYLYNTSQPRMS